MATIVVINGRHQGEWYTIGEKPMIFGRDDTLLAEIIDPRVSRRHLQVHQHPNGTYEAVDLHSHNGTRVNGDRLQPGDAGVYPLAEGDIIQIGHTLLAFTLKEFEQDQEAEEFLTRSRTVHAAMIEKLEGREKYTEAAALFSRIFKRPGS